MRGLYGSALLLVPAEWRAAVARDLEEESARDGRRGVARELWLAWQAAGIGVRLRVRGRALPVVPVRARAGVLDGVRQDARLALRGLRRGPGFTATAMLSLGFGIGATTTVFSVIDALDFRPLSYRDPSRLVWLAEVMPADDRVCGGCAYTTSSATFSDWSGQLHSYAGLGGVSPAVLSWAHDDVIESLEAVAATPGFFGLLGAAPEMGREFGVRDTMAGAEAVALVSHAFWRTRLGGDASVIGRRLVAGSVRPGTAPRSYTIIGVMPADFRFRGEVDVWLPLRLGGGAQRDVRLLTAVGRLAPGHTQAMASAELQGVAARLAQAYPADYRGWGARVEPLRRALDWGAGEGRFVLFGITALVLLIAIMNVAGLLLVRAAVRQHELATRRALGATRMQLWRQQLVEGACLGLGGGLTGILFALWGVRFAVRWFSLESTTFQLGMDRRVLLFASVLAIGGGMVAALLPALRAVRRDPAGSLRVRGVAGGGMGTARTATALIAAQISLGLMLLTAAGLLSADFVALRYVDLGYDPRGLYRTTIHGTREQAADPASWRAVAEAVPARLLEVPGVLAASVEYQSAVHPAIVRAGDGASSSAEMMTPTVKAVNADYFAVWRIPVLLGRAPSAADRAGEPPVAVINRAAAASFWPGRNPLGRTVFLGDSGSVGELLTVVGVTADAERGDMVDRHWPAVYRPLPQARTWHTAARVNIRVAAGRPDVLATAQSVIRQTTDWPPGPFVSEEDALSERLSTRRLNALVLDVFAGFGLLLCAMGVYGSIAFAVTQRTREIGIRMAVGAARRDVFTLFARHGAALALAGVVTGLAGAVALARVFTGFVAGIHVTNPWVFAAAAGLMIGVAFAATLLPARRALRVDPAIALRIE